MRCVTWKDTQLRTNQLLVIITCLSKSIHLTECPIQTVLKTGQARLWWMPEEASRKVPPQAYLCVDNGHHPESSAGPGNRQHGPEEDQNGQHKGDHGGRDHVVQYDHKVAHHFWAGHQGVVHGIEQQQEPGLANVEFLWLFKLIVMEHPVKVNNMIINGSSFLQITDFHFAWSPLSLLPSHVPRLLVESTNSLLQKETWAPGSNLDSFC